MINTSIEYKQAMQENNCCIAKATIILKDGTTIAVDSSQIMQGGVTIDDGTSSTSSFDIGSAIINKLTLQLNNTDDAFSDYNFTDAVINVWIGKQLPDRVEWLKKGVFNAEDPKANTSILTIEALDNMEKFDRDYDGNMTFPTTLQSIVQYCCDKCGVLSNVGQFDFYNYPIAENPFDPDQDYTYREILHYAAQVSGCYARCNVDGRLELKWYDRTIFETNQVDGGYFDAGTPAYTSGDNLDGGNFTDYASGDSADGGDFANASWNQYHHITAISSLEVSTDDVVITGIQVKAMDKKQDNKTLEGETVLFGEKGYVLSISKNPLIPYGKASEGANHLGQKIVGMRFRKMSSSCLGDPSIEAGDAAFVSDRKGNTYQCYITNLTYTTGSFERISTDAETPSRNSSRRYSEITKAIIEAKKDTDTKLSKYDEYVTMLNQLAMNAMGYYQTVVGQDDGSRVTYMHDKPNLSDSQMIYKISIDGFFMSKDGGKTYTHGVDKDGNAVMNIIAAIGIVADWINTRGLKAQDNDGNVTFEVDANTGKVNIKANTFSLQGQSINDIAGNIAGDVAEEIADGKVNQAMDKLNQAAIFNKLTNNGAIQGLYMKDGQLYVNASYILSGLLTLGGANNVNGELNVYDAKGNIVCNINKDGIAAVSGRIGPWGIEDNRLAYYGEVGDQTKPMASLSIFTGIDFRNCGIDIYGANNKNHGLLHAGAVNTTALNINELSHWSDTEIFSGSDTGKNVDTDGLIVAEKFLIYNQKTYSYAPNLCIGGTMQRIAWCASSSKRYKKDISSAKDELLNPEKLYEIEVVQYVYKNGYLEKGDPGIGKTFIGFLAEDVDEKYPVAATYKDKQVESWNERIMVPAMLKLIQDQKKEIDALKKRMDSLEKIGGLNSNGD